MKKIVFIAMIFCSVGLVSGCKKKTQEPNKVVTTQVTTHQPEHKKVEVEQPMQHDENAPKFVEGKDYKILPESVRNNDQVKAFVAQDAGKIQVIEFFSYGCPACNALEPYFEGWINIQPENVVIRRVPATFEPSWDVLAKLYFSLDHFGLLDSLNMNVWNSIHRYGENLFTADNIFKWYQKQETNSKRVTQYEIGLNEFKQYFNSLTVDKQVKDSTKLFFAFKLSSTPAVIVAGKYEVSPHGSWQNMMNTVSYLVKKG